MSILGIFGILQVLFIPGLIITKFIPLPKAFWVKVTSIIGLSLITNYLVVFSSTVLGIFSQPFVLVLFLCEVSILVVFYGKSIWSIRFDTFFTNFWNSFINPLRSLFPTIHANDEEKSYKAVHLIATVVFFIAALVAVELIIRIFRYNLGQIFNTWDAVLSWNKWATQWAQGRFPRGTEDYPQLFPANWAMIYAFIGNFEIQFFAKAIMPLFPILTLLILLSLGIRQKNPGYFISIILLRLTYKKFLSQYLASGYMDIPLTFFALLAVIYLSMIYLEEDQEKRFHWWFLAVIFASGASIVKQPGLYILLWTIPIGYFLTKKEGIATYLKRNWQKIISIIVVIMIIVAPWYLVKNIHFALGIDSSHINIPYRSTSRVHQQGSPIATILPALLSLGKYFYLFLFIIPSLVFVNSFWRSIGIFIVIPYTLIWAMYASYSTRNLTLVFPLFTTIIGLGCWAITRKTSMLLEKINFFRIRIFIPISLLFLGFLIGLGFTNDNQTLYEEQKELQEQLFSPGLNNQLIEYFKDKPDDLRTLTNYPLDYIPSLGGQITFYFDSLEEFSKHIESGKIDYILYPAHTSQSILDEIEHGIEQGFYSVVLQNSEWIPYTLIKIK